jgi:glycosyltransferase involved in cell wall biosynthesis
MEVVGDPYDWFGPGNTKHPLRPFFRWWFSHELRRQCAEARAVAYVTEGALQRRYPTATKALSTHYSDVELSDTAFIPSPRSANVGSDPFTLITVASFNMLYKAQDVLVDAVALCVQQGLELNLVLIGGGAHLSEIEARAKKRKLGSRVRFLGQLPAGPAVRAQLDRADLFVLPSRTEGLPRAMIEAMARGLPCVGSTAGGIPELLQPEDMVPPADAAALSRKIREVVTDPERMARMSGQSLRRAREYREEVLRERRIAFYQYLKERTAVQLGRKR